MKIIKLILSGYKRLFLNNIDYIEYKPESSVQIILGSNGSGKSSLLRMLNPLPAELKKEFKEDGYKLVEIEHRGKMFTLSSGYVGKNKHSFVVEGIEKNMSGIKKIQLELVKEYFNTTNDINNIVLGIDKFTTMSPVVRKQWFTEISTIDYTYPISVYNKLRTRHRDISGSIKMLQDELIIAEETSLTVEELAKLDNDKKALKEYITHIHSLYDHNTSDDTQKYIRAVKEVSSTVDNVITNETIDMDSLYNKIVSNSEHSKLLTDRINLVNENLTKLVDIEANDTDLVKLSSAINALKDKIQEIVTGNKYDLDLANISKTEEVYSDTQSSIADTLTELDTMGSVTTSMLPEVTDEQNVLLRKNRVIENRIALVEEEIKSIQEHHTADNKVSCSKCGNSWYHRYDEIKLKELTDERKQLTLDAIKTTERLLTVNETIVNITNKKKLINNLNQLLSKDYLYSIKTYLVQSYLRNENDISGNITVIENELNKIRVYLNNSIRYPEYVSKLTQLEQQFVKANDLTQVKLDTAALKKTELEDELLALVKQRTVVNENVSVYKQRYSKLKTLEEQYNKLKKLATKKTVIFNMSVAHTRNTHLRTVAAFLSNELMVTEDKIGNAAIRASKITDIKSKLTSYRMKEKVLKLTIKELSPNEGIIAKSINSFLNIFLSEVNYIISSVWSYPMTIEPCSVTDGLDLDYKFKVLVSNNPEPIEDISKLSSSMMDIVDLAFKIVFLKYLDAQDTPLILDEFGKTMDDVHRDTAYTIIERLFKANFEQIYIVNHFESMYGRFTNADITILDSRNLNISNTVNYNGVITIK